MDMPKELDPSALIRMMALENPEELLAHRHVWDVFCIAIAQARNPSADRAVGKGWAGGSYGQSAKALTWLLSADAYAWMDQIGVGRIVPRIAGRINYKRRYREIVNCARQSPKGQAWLDGEEHKTLERLVKDADRFFRGLGDGARVAVLK